MASWTERVRRGWNAFRSKETDELPSTRYEEVSYSYRPDRTVYESIGGKSIVSSVYNRLAMDVAAIKIEHVRTDDNNRFLDVVESGLNYCLTTEANIDQAARAFRQDMALTLFENGHIAVVPVDTKQNPFDTEGFDVLTMRVGKVIKWMPQHVEVEVYNDRTGKRQNITLPKRLVAIVENPLYSVMNEPNSTLKRLEQKISLLDRQDKRRNDPDKLDIIIQLPYVVKTQGRQQQAEERRQAIEAQLANSKYGIAYIDGTEKITQLNRPIENTLVEQIDRLKSDLFNLLGLTEEVFKGIANEEAMLNYYTRTIEPVVQAIAEEFDRKFLSKTARTRGQAVWYTRDPFSLVPVEKLSDIADKFTRNEILSGNEVRQIIGFKPVDDPSADELRNKNMPIEDQPQYIEEGLEY